ncbi:MAG TPA: universal stress protein [Herbaspirillum sp.]|jgi:nucleotide-binding universal stress UspA family protein
MFKTILLATDGSLLSDLAIGAAIDFAKINGSRVVGMSVVESYGYLPMTALSGGVDIGAIDESLEVQAHESVEKIASLAAKEGVACETYILTGVSPYVGILKCAREHGCDGIFMASHGRTGLDKIILGSVAQKVLAHSNMPVLIYKEAVDEPGKTQKKKERLSALSIGSIA